MAEASEERKPDLKVVELKGKGCWEYSRPEGVVTIYSHDEELDLCAVNWLLDCAKAALIRDLK